MRDCKIASDVGFEQMSGLLQVEMEEQLIMTTSDTIDKHVEGAACLFRDFFDARLDGDVIEDVQGKALNSGVL